MVSPDEPPLFENRERAGSFGADAELYDAARPRYPGELFAFLVRDEPLTALDVGCGTGIAARQLRSLGVDVVGIEPDPRMADVARRSGVEVEIGDFETWDARGRTFDLLTAAQAWHWVDPARGTAKAADVVHGGGRFGVFWNLAQPPEELARHVDPVYARLAPDLQPYSVLLGQGGPSRLLAADEALRADRRWEAIAQRDFSQRITYTTDSWMAYLRTHSDHATLSADRREPLLDAVRAAIDAMGGQFEMTFRTALVTALRR